MRRSLTHAALTPTAIDIPAPPHALMQGADEALTRWIEAAAGCLGLEAEPVDAPYAEVEQLVRRAGPALLRWPGPGEPRFLALLGGRRRAVSILGPDRVVHRLQSEVLRTALCQTIELPLVAEVTRLLDEAGVPKRRQARARAAILRERLSPVRLDGCWLLRLPPGASLWGQVRHARLPRHLVGLIGAHAIQYFLVLLSWWMIGRGALEGRLDWGWLLAWALLLLYCSPVPAVHDLVAGPARSRRRGAPEATAPLWSPPARAGGAPLSGSRPAPRARHRIRGGRISRLERWLSHAPRRGRAHHGCGGARHRCGGPAPHALARWLDHLSPPHGPAVLPALPPLERGPPQDDP